MATTRGPKSTAIDWRRLLPGAVQTVTDGQQQAQARGIAGWAIYARISQDRSGEGLGTERQLEDGLALAQRMDVPVVDIYVDNDLSAYSGKPRDDYERLLTDVGSGGIGGIISWHPERLHRNQTELERFIDVCQPRDVPTHMVRAGILDMSTASGRMTARITGAVARHDSELKSERIVRQKEQAAYSGRQLGGPRVFGFEPDGGTVRPDEAAEIVAAIEAIVTGASLRSVVEGINARRVGTSRGNELWQRSSFKRMLLRPRNAGYAVYRGEIVGDAAHPAIVPDEQWRAAVSILTDPSRRTAMSNRVKWLGSGLYLCGGCGRPEMRVSATTRGQRGYRCWGRRKDVTHVTRRADVVDEYVESVLIERLQRDDSRDLLSTGADTVDTAALQAEATAKRQRLDDLSAAFADGDISRQQLRAGSEKLRARIESIDSELAAAGRHNPLVGVVDAPDVARAWHDLDISRRRAVLDALLTVTVLPWSNGRQKGGGYFNPDSVRIDWKR